MAPSAPIRAFVIIHPFLLDLGQRLEVLRQMIGGNLSGLLLVSFGRLKLVGKSKQGYRRSRRWKRQAASAG